MKVDLTQIWHDLKARRYRFRQPLGGAYAIALLLLAEPGWWGLVIGSVLCVLGSGLRFWAAGYICKSKVLETRGPYSLVRHPQYLGNSLIGIGAAVASGRLWGIAVWVLLFILFYLPAIEREDDKLHRRFGETWRKWREKTPAVIPLRLSRLSSGLRLSEWSVVQAARNGEPVWLVCIAAGLYLLWSTRVSGHETLADMVQVWLVA